MTYNNLFVLKKDPSCKHYGAQKFQCEAPSFCCSSGEVKLAINDVPQNLYDLFTSQREDGKQFRKHIRAYNNIFPFTPFEVKLDKKLASQRNGVYTFKA